MEWLSEWIKQIILLVLIATFIDLLLPNQSFDRYVKLVLGLLIIMAILTPILQLVNQDIDFRTWKWWNTDQPALSMNSLPSIQADSKRLQEFQTKQIEEQWSKNVGREIQEELTKKFALQNVQVVVKTNIQDGKTPRIQSVEVYAQTRESSKKDHSDRSLPIEPIDIQIEERKEEETKRHPLTESIKKTIIRAWHLKAEQVSVFIENGA